MVDFRVIIIVTVTFVISYGLWYLVFWLLTSQSSPFLWPWWVKLIYLILAASHANNMIDKVKSNEE